MQQSISILAKLIVLKVLHVYFYIDKYYVYSL